MIWESRLIKAPSHVSYLSGLNISMSFMVGAFSFSFSSFCTHLVSIATSIAVWSQSAATIFNECIWLSLIQNARACKCLMMTVPRFMQPFAAVCMAICLAISITSLLPLSSPISAIEVRPSLLIIAVWVAAIITPQVVNTSFNYWIGSAICNRETMNVNMSPYMFHLPWFMFSSTVFVQSYAPTDTFQSRCLRMGHGGRSPLFLLAVLPGWSDPAPYLMRPLPRGICPGCRCKSTSSNPPCATSTPAEHQTLVDHTGLRLQLKPLHLL